MTDQEIGDYSSYQPPDFWDYYYSHTMAAQDNFLCHTVDGKAYTEPTYKRQVWLKQHEDHLAQIIFCPRVSFTGDGKTDNCSCNWYI